MKVYISGKMSGLPTEVVIEKFGRAEKKLVQQGHSVFNPAVFFNLGDISEFSYEDFMAVDFAMLSVCDVLYVLRDWPDSKGARREIEYAVRRGLGIIYERDE